MDPVSALELASSVMKVIQFSLTAVRAYGEISKTGSTSSNQLTSESSEQIARSAGEVHERLCQLKVTSTSFTSAETDLQNLANQCIKTANTLQAKLSPVQKEGSGRTRAILKATCQFIFGDSEREDLEKRLRTYEDSLRTRILVNLNTKQAIQHLEQQGRLDCLNANLRDSIRSLADNQTTTKSLIQNEAVMNRQLIIQRGQETEGHLNQTLQAQRDEDTARAQHSRLLGSLRFPEMNARRNTVEKSHKNTFEWIFVENQSNKWASFPWFLQGSEKVYWISGKPGAGKSCLMKYVSRASQTNEIFRKWKPQSSIMIISHFLWMSGTKMQKSAKCLFISLLYQLLEDSPDLAKRLVSWCPQLAKYYDISDWSESEIYSSLKKTFELTADVVCAFIDGLDEIGSDYGNLKLVKLIKDLSLLENLKLCVSSRPETEFNMHLSHYPQLKLEDLTRKDIEILARDTLEDASRGHLGCIERDQLEILTNLTVCKAEGVFLWVRYALQSLCSGLLGHDDWKTLEMRLTALPPEMGDLYREMWMRLNRNKKIWRADAAWYFQFVINDTMFFSRKYTLLALTLFKNPTFRDDLIRDRRYDKHDLLKLCLETKHQGALTDYLRKENDHEDEAYRMTYLLIEICQDLGHRHGESSLKVADNFYSSFFKVAEDAIGSLVEHSPELAYPFLQRFNTHDQITGSYANYILACTSVKCFPSSYFETFDLLKYRFTLGADPSARFPEPWYIADYCPSHTFIDYVLRMTRLSSITPDKLKSLEKFKTILMRSKPSLNQDIWIALSGDDLKSFSQEIFLEARCYIIMIVDMFTFIRWIASAMGSVVFQTADTPLLEEKADLWRVVYFVLPPENFSGDSEELRHHVLCKPTEEDAELLSSAVRHYLNSLDQREELRELITYRWVPLGILNDDWEGTVYQTMKQVMDRCEIFLGEDDRYTELVRAGKMMHRDLGEISKKRVPEDEPKLYRKLVA
ncbi:MAG: hypothetical protein Q9160_004967 [Pyrenula sp. 1 TL-2023]